jgi:hypothetical protein
VTVPIAALIDVCESMAARHRALFELLGGWVTDDADGGVQRWWSSAAHRHAWHADLWQSRRPAIPVDAAAPDPAPGPPDDDRVAWYLERLTELRADTAAVAATIDPDLDPATARVTRLVATDLDDLIATAP